MYKTGIAFTIDGFDGELVEQGGKLLRKYKNGEYEYADDIDEAVLDAVNDDEFFFLDGLLGQIEEDTYRVYRLA